MSVLYRDACTGISFPFYINIAHLHCCRGLVAKGVCNMRGFALIYFNSPFLCPVVDLIDGGFEFTLVLKDS
jgi:hypothetical protein